MNLGLSMSGNFPAADGAKNQFLVGPEIGIRLTPIGKHRTPVFDVFARAEFGVRSPNPAVVSIGARCLLGANAGIGISLGDDCVVEAGCYVTAGTKVTLPAEGRVVKAAELSGASNVLFRRNSVTGTVEAVAWKGEGIALNSALHAN